MDKLSLMQQFADPELIHQLSLGEKTVGSLIVAIMGMGVTFVVLILLMYLIEAMTKIINGFQKKDAAVVKEPDEPVSGDKPAVENMDVTAEKDDYDEDLVAVITAALAAGFQYSGQNFVVRKIRRVADLAPNWSKAAKNEQLDSRRF